MTATGAVVKRAAPPVVLARCRRSGAKTLVTLVLEGRAVPVLRRLRPPQTGLAGDTGTAIR